MTTLPRENPPGPPSVWQLMMSIVPQDCEIDDPDTTDAKRVMKMHIALYGRPIKGYEDRNVSVEETDGD